jgi:hypothetical protein
MAQIMCLGAAAYENSILDYFYYVRGSVYTLKNGLINDRDDTYYTLFKRKGKFPHISGNSEGIGC